MMSCLLWSCFVLDQCNYLVMYVIYGGVLLVLFDISVVSYFELWNIYLYYREQYCLQILNDMEVGIVFGNVNQFGVRVILVLGFMQDVKCVICDQFFYLLCMMYNVFFIDFVKLFSFIVK